MIHIKHIFCHFKQSVKTLLYKLRFHYYRAQHRIPVVLTIDETIDQIIKTKASISRYGDGEVDLMCGKSINFQSYDLRLSQKLNEIVRSNDSNHLVCLPPVFGDLSIYDDYGRWFWNDYLISNLSRWVKYIQKDKSYYNAFISRLYMVYRDKSKAGSYFSKIRQIWDQRSILIIEGEQSRLGIGNDLFDNALSVERILAPSLNAFDHYDEILKAALTTEKDKLILIALGPTATVLAYDLYKQGYQALDIGHIDVEYEWFLAGATEKIKLKNKFVNEATGGQNPDPLIDPLYQSQIIARINV